jgi:hypothetical protein
LTTPLPLSPVREAWLIQIFFSHRSTNEEITALPKPGWDIRQTLAASAPVRQKSRRGAARHGAGYALWQITRQYGEAF